MNNLEDLLQRYSEGTLTSDERAELNRLTHRDTVVHAALQGAQQIRHRRQVRISAVASVLLVAGCVLFLRPNASIKQSDMPMMAHTNTSISVPQATIQAQSAQVLDVASATDELRSNSDAISLSESQVESVVEPKSTVSRQSAQSTLYEVQSQMSPEIVIPDETVVACNTSCSPDSVISDIWKFLRA